MFIRGDLEAAILGNLQPDPWNGRWSQVMDFGAGNAVELEVGELLYSLVRAVKPETVVETGTHKGYSTLLIAAALEANRRGHIHSVDIADYGVQALLEKYGLGARGTFILGDSATVLSALSRKKIDFLWLDADHGTEFVLRELASAAGALSPGSYVAFHDTLSDTREAKAVALVQAQNPSWEHVHFSTARGFDLMRVRQ